MEPVQGQQTPRSQYLAQLLAQGAASPHGTPQQVMMGLGAQALMQNPGGILGKPGHALGGLFHLGSGQDLPGQFGALAKQFRPGG